MIKSLISGICILLLLALGVNSYTFDCDDGTERFLDSDFIFTFAYCTANDTYIPTEDHVSIFSGYATEGKEEKKVNGTSTLNEVGINEMFSLGKLYVFGEDAVKEVFDCNLISPDKCLKLDLMEEYVESYESEVNDEVINVENIEEEAKAVFDSISLVSGIEDVVSLKPKLNALELLVVLFNDSDVKYHQSAETEGILSLFGVRNKTEDERFKQSQESISELYGMVKYTSQLTDEIFTGFDNKSNSLHELNILLIDLEIYSDEANLVSFDQDDVVVLRLKNIVDFTSILLTEWDDYGSLMESKDSINLDFYIVERWLIYEDSNNVLGLVNQSFDMFNELTNTKQGYESLLTVNTNIVDSYLRLVSMDQEIDVFISKINEDMESFEEVYVARNNMLVLRDHMKSINMTDDDGFDIISLLSIFDKNKTKEYDLDQINEIVLETDKSIQLSNMILFDFTYSSEVDVSLLEMNVIKIKVLSEKAGVISYDDKFNEKVMPRLISVSDSNTGLLLGNDTISLKSSKIDLLKSLAWMNSFNSSEEERYSSVDELVNDALDLIDMVNSSEEGYGYIVILDGIFKEIDILIEKPDEQVIENLLFVRSLLIEDEILLYNSLTSWNSINDMELLVYLLEIRDKIIYLDNILLFYNGTKIGQENNILNKLRELVNSRDKEKLIDVKAKIYDTEHEANRIITDIGYNGISDDIHGDTISFIESVVDLTNSVNDVLGIGYVPLKKGPNLVSFDSDHSFDIISGIKESVIKIEYYDNTTWKTYNPNALYGNQLTDLDSGLYYWIWMKNDAILEVSE